MALTKIDDRGLKTPIDLIDNEKIRLGTHNDLEIYHDGNNSFLEETGTGGLYFRSSTVGFRDIANNNELWIDMNSNAGVDLYYNGIKTFATEDNGAYIYGPEGGIAQLMLYADEGDDNPDKWRMAASASASQFNLYNFNDGAWETSIECNGSGNVELYYDNDLKLFTRSAGAEVTTTGAVANFIVRGKEGYGACLTLASDDGDDPGDYARILQHTDEHLYFQVYNAANNAYEDAIVAKHDGAVELYHDNSLKFETSSAGATCTGDFTVKGDSGNSEAFVDLSRIDDPANNQNVGVIEFSHGSASSRLAARIITRRDGGGWGASSLPTRFEFHTCVSGSNTAAERVRISSSGNLNILDGDLQISTAGHGIDFSATSDAAGKQNELLDDYEEGTFQANIKFGGASANISHTDYAGRYTKIGRLVTCSFVISLSSKGTSTGEATINALPFTSTNDSHDRMGGLVTHFSPMTNVTSQIVLYMTTNESKIGLYDCSSTGVTAITDSNFADNTMIRGFIQYHCA